MNREVLKCKELNGSKGAFFVIPLTYCYWLFNQNNIVFMCTVLSSSEISKTLIDHLVHLGLLFSSITPLRFVRLKY